MSSLSDEGRTLHLIALGNRYRGDDGIAPILIERLTTHPPAGIVTHDWGDSDALTLAHDLLELDGAVLIVDCAELDASPGGWQLFDEDALNGYRGSSTHGLGLADALALVRQLGFSQPLHCFGIQPADLADRADLSPALQEALPALEAALLNTIEKLFGRRAA